MNQNFYTSTRRQALFENNLFNTIFVTSRLPGQEKQIQFCFTILLSNFRHARYLLTLAKGDLLKAEVSQDSVKITSILRVYKVQNFLGNTGTFFQKFDDKTMDSPKVITIVALACSSLVVISCMLMLPLLHQEASNLERDVQAQVRNFKVTADGIWKDLLMLVSHNPTSRNERQAGGKISA